jgi:hypothetical protein
VIGATPHSLAATTVEQQGERDRVQENKDPVWPSVGSRGAAEHEEIVNGKML